jgi:hypothetical protein
VISWLDSNWLRVIAYGVAAAACVHAGLRERHRRPIVPSRDFWPTFWSITAALLAVMALGRAAEIGELVSEFGRREAREEGWYEIRREYQAAAVASIGAIWMVSVVVAVWRVPERRRRYLPAAVAVFSLVCFAGIRIVSLHQVDALLYNRPIRGVRIVAIVELSGIALAILTTYWHPFARARPDDAIGRRSMPLDASLDRRPSSTSP